MNDEFVLKLRIYARLEMALARIGARRSARQAAYYAMALLLILLAIAMFNVAAYDALTDLYGRGIGALIVAAANGVLAVFAVMIAGRMKPGPEEEAVKEMREFAAAELSTDVEEFKREVREISDSIKSLKSGVGGFFSGGDAFLSGLSPLVSLLVSSLKKVKK